MKEMTNNTVTEIQPFKRVSTGIKGLDEIMYGGFLRGGIYLIMGSPGAGKTILANQIGFNHVAKGGRALYISLLSEGHGRLFGHLHPLKFFNESVISTSFNFISAYQTLEIGGLDGLLKSLAQLVRQYKANLVILDGVASAEELAKSPLSFKKFVHDLNTVLSTSGCTALLLSSFTENLSHPEHTMVDGIISISNWDDGMQAIRQLEVTKLRGSNHLRGRHLFSISDQGVAVFPRIETLWKASSSPVVLRDNKFSTGIDSLDKILKGGFSSGTVTSLLGAAGTGKTTLGCQFLYKGAVEKEPGLYFGFYESPSRLLKKNESINMHLGKYLKSGVLEVLWQPPSEYSIDEVVDQMMQNIIRRGVKRLFIDGIVGLREGIYDMRRLYKALGALSNRLRFLDVTTYFSEETDLFPIEVKTPISDHSAITDNILFLRHIELNGKLTRFLSVVKTRESESSSCIHEFKLTSTGIELGSKVDGLEPVLTGVHPGSAAAYKKLRSSTKSRRGLRRLT